MKALRLFGQTTLQVDDANDTLELLTLRNPAYESARRYSKRIDPTISEDLTFGVKRSDTEIEVPRGFQTRKTDYESVTDLRSTNRVVIPEPMIPLYDFQTELVDNLYAEILSSPINSCLAVAKTGAGKTYIGLNLAYRLQQKTLILVHTNLIKDAWIKSIEQVFGVTPGEIQRDRCNLDSPFVVAMVQTLNSRDLDNDLIDQFGFLIQDEVHHIPAMTFSKALWNLNMKYRLGLSATPSRSDGLTPVISWFFGRVIQAEQPSHNVMDIENIHVYYFPYKGSYFKTGLDFNVNRCIDTYLSDYDYWRIIARDIIESAESDLSCLAVVNTIHRYGYVRGKKEVIGLGELGMLENALREQGCDPVVVCGSTSKKDRTRLIELVQNRTHKVLISTCKYIEEGADIPCLSRLFVASPVFNSKKFQQLAGRIRRIYPRKISAEINIYLQSQEQILNSFSHLINNSEIFKKAMVHFYEY